jgi:hypothetical protein
MSAEIAASAEEGRTGYARDVPIHDHLGVPEFEVPVRDGHPCHLHAVGARGRRNGAHTIDIYATKVTRTPFRFMTIDPPGERFGDSFLLPVAFGHIPETTD